MNVDSEHSVLYKPAMLAFLLLAIGIAWLVVSGRRTTRYAGPVKLGSVGVSVFIPQGSQWHRPTAGWSYDKNVFSLISVLRISSSSAITVRWQYQFLPGSRDPARFINIKAKSFSGTVSAQDTHNLGSAVLHTAEIVSRNEGLKLYYAVLPVISGHMLTLEVARKGNEAGMAKDIFDHLISTIGYSQSLPVRNGIKLISDFRSGLLRQIPPRLQGPRYYLIKGAGSDILGFLTDGITISVAAETNEPVVAASFYYMNSPKNSFIEQSLFRADRELSGFEWVTRQGSPNSGNPVTIRNRLDPNGIMSIDILNRIKIGRLVPSSLAVPDILFDVLAVSATSEKFTTAFVDIVMCKAVVLPALLSVETAAAGAKYKYIVEAKFLDGTSRLQKTYIDASGRIIRTEVEGETDYTIESVSAEDLLVRFGRWSRQINQVRDYLTMKKGKF